MVKQINEMNAAIIEVAGRDGGEKCSPITELKSSNYGGVLSMMNEHINDKKLLGKLIPPEEFPDFLEDISKDWGCCSNWTIWQAYELGVMYGKRAERQRRKKETI